MNVIDYMIRFEEDGLHLYEALACDSSDSELRTIYNLLADSQRKHLTELIDLKGGKGGIPEDSKLVERAEHVTTIFRHLLESRDIHAELKLDPDGIGHIIAAEEEYIKLLEGMAKAEPAGETGAFLKRMGVDEQEHLERILNIYEFITAPHTYLEWGEFSNLHAL
jgi:rubrerythrin